MKVGYIQTKFWNDPYIQSLCAIDKFLFLYLRTNQYVSICGIYEISEKTILFETCVSEKQLKDFFKRTEIDKKLFYRNNYIFLVNFEKNIYKPNDNLVKGIENEKKLIPAHILALFENLTSPPPSPLPPPPTITPSPSPSPSPKIISKDITKLSVLNGYEKNNLKEIQTPSLFPEEKTPESSEAEKKKKLEKQEIRKKLDILYARLKVEIGVDDFQESQKQQRQWLMHLRHLGQKISPDEFFKRLRTLIADPFHLKNMNKLAYIYKQLKSFNPEVWKK